MSDDQAWHGEQTQVPEPRRRRTGALVLAVVSVLAVIGAGVWLWMRSNQPPPPVAEAPPAPDAAVAPPAAVLSIADGEALLRKLAQELSPVKELSTWLSQSDILRRLVAAVNLTADGKTPAPVLSFLKPAHGGFEVVRKKKKTFVSPKSGAGYAAMVAAVESVDPAAAGRALGQLDPYFEVAYAEIAPKGKTFSARLLEALGEVQATPIPEGQPELVTKGLGWAYKDPALERLSPAKKQLIRLGPANAKALKAWLAKFQAALPPSTAGN